MVKAIHAYTVKERILSGPRLNVLLRKTIFASELKVTCCSLSRSHAVLPLNGAHRLTSFKRLSSKVEVLSESKSTQKKHIQSSCTRKVSLRQQSPTTKSQRTLQHPHWPFIWSQTYIIWKTNVRASFQPECFPTSQSNPQPLLHKRLSLSLGPCQHVAPFRRGEELLWSPLRHVFL